MLEQPGAPIHTQMPRMCAARDDRLMSVQVYGAHMGMGARAAVVVAAVLGMLCLAPAANAFIYFSDNDSIGRANNDGTGVIDPFISTFAAGLAVDSGHLYWARPASGSIGRASLDKEVVDNNFIGTGDLPQGVTVDATHIYWVDGVDVGRADLDGQGGLISSFIPADNGPHGVAVDAGHVYWTNLQDNSSIGRADIDGNSGSVDQFFISQAFFPEALVVNATHLYWADGGMGAVGRADIDGSPQNQGFIPGANDPEGVAIDGSHVYWTNHQGASIGRANLDGSGVDQTFIDG